ncbi:MAG: Crp/Fnr family transcriptional regulator [Pseudomonadota bacterium]
MKVHAILSNTPLFREADPAEIGRIARGTRELHATRGEILFQKSDTPQGFYIVVYGQIKLAFCTPQGAEKVVDIVGAGQSFGEAVMFIDKPYLVYAQAIADSLLLHIDKAAVFAELERNPAFGRKMLAGLSRRLHALVSDMEAYSLRSATARVIGYLLRHEAEESGADQTLRIRLPASKGLIASRLNLSPETFSRILHDLGTAGLISVDGREILVHDLERLRGYGH